jgi:hypothetical protein
MRNFGGVAGVRGGAEKDVVTYVNAISITLIRKMCPSLCRFPWNLQMFNSIMFRFLYQISPK